MWNSTNRREPMFLFYKCTFLSTPFMCIAMWKMWPPILLISTKWTTTPHLLITEHNVSVDIYCVNSITIPLYYFVTLGSKEEFRDPCNLPRWVLDSPFSVVTSFEILDLYNVSSGLININCYKYLWDLID